MSVLVPKPWKSPGEEDMKNIRNIFLLFHQKFQENCFSKTCHHDYHDHILWIQPKRRKTFSLARPVEKTPVV